MKTLFTLLSILCFASFSKATIALPEVLSDNMVLQQNSVIKIWGTSSIKKNVTVRASWTNTVFSSTCKPDGSFEISIFTPKGSFDKHTISVSDGLPITLKNILVGEVWFCAGQSNMAMTFSGYKNQPIENAKEEIANAKEESGIRTFNVEKSASYQTNIPIKGKWLVSNAKNLAAFSVVGYYYALQLQKSLHVPIGIINSSYGGSTIEGWLNQSTVQKYSDYPYTTSIPDSLSQLRPSVMFQGMVRPYRNIRVKGFIWYQGEGNVGRSATYAQKLQDLAYLWRYTFDDPNLPIYAVEIAPYLYESISEPAKIREAAFNATHALENAGIVCTNDLVPGTEATCIHPPVKKPIGERLGNLSLLKTYRLDSIQALSPEFDHLELHGDAVILFFKNSYEGLQHEGVIAGFELGNAAHEFHSVSARIGENKSTVIIPLEKGTSFHSVRYCFKNYQVGNVKNSAGLPLFPFRTDDWAE
jgi:sialate O-acetylesterase